MENSRIVNKKELERIACELRLDILEMTTRAGSGHPSSSFSPAEIVTALFFAGLLRYRSEDPWWPDREGLEWRWEEFRRKVS